MLKPEVELQAAAARAAVSAGRSSTAEALAAEAAVAQLNTRLLRMQSEARQASFELARWIDTDAARPLAPMPSLDELPTPPAALLATVHEHGSLLTFESQIEAARLDVDLAKAQRRPDWSAELAFAKRGADFSDMVSLEFRIGLPLFTKYRQDPQVSARHAELRRIEAEREAELRMHTAEIQQMLTQWEQLGEQVEQYERELLPLARERSRAALASYRAGRGDLRLALDAYSQEIEFVIEHAQLRERTRARLGVPALSRSRASARSAAGHRHESAALEAARLRPSRSSSSALAGGYWVAQRRNATPPIRVPRRQGERKVLYWHDPMVPSARFDKPGKSPFMDMQLVPVYADEEGGAAVTVSPDRQPEPRHPLGTVEKAVLQPKLPAVGSVAFDERLLEVVQARVEGYVTRLHVKAPLERVRRGQPLADIVAPAWLEAQEEYLALLDAQSEPRASDPRCCAPAAHRARRAGEHDS